MRPFISSPSKVLGRRAAEADVVVPPGGAPVLVVAADGGPERVGPVGRGGGPGRARPDGQAAGRCPRDSAGRHSRARPFPTQPRSAGACPSRGSSHGRRTRTPPPRGGSRTWGQA